MATQMSLSDFGKTIKKKYPQYAQMDDVVLAKMVIQKYPQYESLIFKGEESQPVQEQSQPKKSFGRKVVDFFTSSEQGFGNTLGTAASVVSPQVNKMRNDATLAPGTAGGELKDATSRRLLDAMKKYKDSDPVKYNKAKTQFERNAKDQGVDVFSNPEYQKTVGQVAGEALGVVADIASFGSYGNAAKGAKTGQLLIQGEKSAKSAQVLSKLGVQATTKAPTSVAKTAGKAFIQGVVRQAPTGAALGSAYGAAQSLQEGKTGFDVVKDTATGAVTGGVLSGLAGGLGERSTAVAPQKAQKLQEQAVALYQKGLGATKEKYKLMGDRIIPSLLKDNVWGTRRSLLAKAEQGIELAAKDYEKLGELQGYAQIDGIIGSIGKEMEKLKGPDGRILSPNMSKYRALQELQADIFSYQVKDAIAKNPVAAQEGLRQYRAQLDNFTYGSKKSITTVEESQKLGPMKDVADSIRGLLEKNNPEFADINKLFSTNTKLRDILEETARRKQAHSWIGLIDSVAGGGGGTVGALAGLATGHAPGAIAGGIMVGGTSLAINKIMNSTWFNTLRAVQKNKIATRLLKMSPAVRNKWILYISRQGNKGVDRLFKDQQNPQITQPNK